MSCPGTSFFCFSGLFDSRHGWTIQLHDSGDVYEAAGGEFVLDLIGEMEVPSSLPHDVAPFLVSMSQSPERKAELSRRSSGAPHRPDLDRQMSVDVYEPLPLPTDFASSIASVKENLRFVQKKDSNSTGSLNNPIPPPPPAPPAPPLITELTAQLNKQDRMSSSSKASSMQDRGPSQPSNGFEAQKSKSKMNERPKSVNIPAMARQSLMNKR